MLMLELGSALALLGVPLACHLGLADAVALPKRALLAVAASLVGAAWFSGGGRFRRDLLALGAPTLGLWLTATTLAWGWPAEGQGDALTWLSLGVLGWGWCALLTPERERRWWGYAILGAALVAAYAWLQRLGWDPLPWSNPHLARERTIATLGNPDYLALYLVVVAPVALERVAGWTGVARLAGLAGWLAGALALALTTARGSWVAGVVAALVGARKRLLGVALLLAVGLALATCWQTGDYSLAARARSLTDPRDLSFTTRLYLWKAAFRLANQRPLTGWGFGRYPYRSLVYRAEEPAALRGLERMPEDPHSEYFRLLVTGGYPALALWLVLLAGMARRLTGSRRAALAALGVNLVFLSLTPEVAVLWLLLLAGATRTDSRPEVEKRSAARVVVGVVVVALVVGGAARALWADALLLQADDLGHSPAALSGYHRALRLAPRFRRGVLWERVASYHFQECLQGSQASLVPGLEACQEALDLAPENPYRWAARAYFLELAGRQPEAEAAYTQALTIDPWNYRLWSELGALRAGGGRLEAAVEAFRRSLQAYPRGEVALDLGHALLLLGRTDEAEAAFAQALALNPGLQSKVQQLRGH